MYSLALLERIIDSDQSVLPYWTTLLVESGGASDPFAPLTTLLARSSEFIVTKAAVLLAKALACPPPSPEKLGGAGNSPDDGRTVSERVENLN